MTRSNGTSERRALLAYHPKPAEDELLSSWLRRIALGNARKTQSFCHLIWPGKQIWTRDLDTSVSGPFVDDLAERTGTVRDSAWATTLASWEGVLFERPNGCGGTPLIGRVGVYHRARRQPGLQWCPNCLESDAKPYYRKAWRLSFVTACETHQTLLACRCHACGEPAAPHRRRDEACYNCGADRRDHPTFAIEPWSLRVQGEMLRVLRGEHEPRFGMTVVHPLAYFRTVHKLMSMLAFGARAAALRAELSKCYGIDPGVVPSSRYVETGEVAERAALMTMVELLLRDWPYRLVAALKASKLWWAWALGDANRDRLPFVLDRALREHLFLGGIPSSQSEPIY